MLLALVGLAIPPAGFAVARQLARVTLVQATAATCASAVLGIAAILLARRARTNIDRTLAAFALGFYGLLNLFG